MGVPPSNPTEGDRWRSGGANYIWQTGKGWVAAADYRRAALGRRGKTAADLGLIEPEPGVCVVTMKPDTLAVLMEGLKAQIRATNAYLLTVPDRSPRWHAWALIGALHVLRARLQLGHGRDESTPRCASCGGPRSKYSARLCRACFVAGIRSPGKPTPPGPTCSDCGAPRSPVTKGPRCRACWRAKQAAERVPPPPPSVCQDCGGECSPLSKRCRICWRTRQASGRPPRCRETIEVKGVVGLPLRSAPTPAPQPAAPAQPEPPTPAPPPAPPVPVVAPPAPPPAARQPSEAAPAPCHRPVGPTPTRQEQHPILERHARAIDRGQERPTDPLTRTKRAKPQAEPEFSPEFLAQLARVREGAQIVEVRPISHRDVADSLGAASLEWLR
jgi:hypothetical protein